ncbi:MAG: PAS domain S-box protein [Candidatus Lokiarchaeota archaeon]|nr:PAS domain S-box protein [Candidatus Lokiarchaeota archaeon]MBD3202449.1 PAS domain S-box protein [Candidatus Lokiarchaeota archaeon]
MKSQKVEQEKYRIFKKIVENSPIGLCIFYDNSYFYSNQKFDNLFKEKFTKRDDFNPSDMVDLIYQADKDSVRNLISTCIKNKGLKSTKQIRLLNNNNELYWVNLNCICQQINSVESLIFSFVNIDEKISAQNYLQRRLEFETIIMSISSRFVGNIKFKLAIENTLRDIGVLSEASRSYLVIFNEKNLVKEFFQWSSESVIPSKSKQDIERFIFCSKWIEKLAKGEYIHIENFSNYPLEAKKLGIAQQKGKINSCLVFPLFIKAEFSGLIGLDNINETKKWKKIDLSVLRISSQIIGNAMERISAQEELRKSEKKYRHILENLTESYFEVDLKGNFTNFNDSFCKKLGYTREELEGMNYGDILNEDNMKKVFRIYNQLFQERREKLTFEVEVKKKDGSIIIAESSAYLKRNSNGKLIGFYGLARDVTEKRQAEKLKEKFQNELESKVKNRTKELNEALEHQKKYQEEILKASKFKSDFLATMSHELRTPLNAIIGFTDLLLESAFGELNEQQKEYLTDIKTSAEHQYDMISNILDITKIESGQITLSKQYFSLNTVIDQINSNIKNLYTKKGLEFVIKGLNDDMQIYADPIRFKEILLNLLTNAIKFTIQGKITLVIREGYDSWVFKVRDTGIGIASEDFDLVFKEFKRVDSSFVRSTSGTGLGLSLTKRLVELHNGEISFSSLLGSGTTFTIKIPKKKEDLDVKL